MRLGIDLGGTKIAAIVLDEEGRVVWERRTPAPRDDYRATIEALAGLVIDAERDLRLRCTVGIGIPGAISPATGLVKNANSTWLNGQRLSEDLDARLSRPVRLANDANCLAISEAADGAARDAEVVFGVILGTGTGGGVVVRGRVLVGANSIAGEWGHNPLPWPDDDERPGRACYCGRHGCLETFLSGPGLAADYAAHGGAPDRSEAIVERAAVGEALASQTLDRWERRLAKSLATVINVLDPDVVVVGGGLSAIERLYVNVPRQLGPWVFSDRIVTKVVRAKHGDASGVRGAAWLWPATASRRP
jgi:fructokinase